MGRVRQRQLMGAEKNRDGFIIRKEFEGNLQHEGEIKYWDSACVRHRDTSQRPNVALRTPWVLNSKKKLYKRIQHIPKQLQNTFSTIVE